MYRDREWLLNQLVKSGSGSAIARSNNYSAGTVNRWIVKHGLQKYRNTGQTQRRHKLRENYFESIDTEEKAYILGFIMADGCISRSKTSYDISITLGKKDKDILLKIQREWETTTPIRESKAGVQLKVSSKKMYKDLEGLGVVRKKTGKESFPDLSHDLKKHFIRGFFDGDGSFIYYPKNYVYGGFYLCCSNKQMLLDIQKYLKEELEVDVIVKKPRSQSVYQCRTSKTKSSLIIYNHIYKTPSIYLKRKHTPIQNFINEYGPLYL